MKLLDRFRHKRESWEVQGFLLPSVTGSAEYGYQVIRCASEKEADAWVARLYRDHGPGMVRVEKRIGQATSDSERDR